MSLGHRTINCAREGCFAVITVHPDDEERLRRTHERFYCPAGHSNYFPGKTPDEKRRDELERHNRLLEREVEEAWKQRQAEHDVCATVARGLQVCPLGCGWRSTRRLGWMPDEESVGRFLDRVGSDLAAHLTSDHNATKAPVALLNPGGTAHVPPMEAQE